MSDQTTPRRCPIWVKVLLGLSLAFNLGIVGLVGGFALRSDGPIRNAGPGLGYAMPYVIALEREARRDIFRTVREDPDLPSRTDRRAHFADMLEALRADPMDRAAVEAVLSRQAKGVSDVQLRAQSAWLAKVVEMSADERVQYADKVEDILKRGPKRGKKNGEKKKGKKN